MKKIELGINFSEEIQFIDQTHEVTLDNGYEVIFNVTADVTVSENIGANYYEESQVTVDVQNLEIDILEVWDNEDLLELSEERLKAIRKEIKDNIE